MDESDGGVKGVGAGSGERPLSVGVGFGGFGLGTSPAVDGFVPASVSGLGTRTTIGVVVPRLPWVPGPIATPTKRPKPSAIADSGAVQRRSTTGSAAQRSEAKRRAVRRSGRIRPRTSLPGSFIASGPPRDVEGRRRRSPGSPASAPRPPRAPGSRRVPARSRAPPRSKGTRSRRQRPTPVGWGVGWRARGGGDGSPAAGAGRSGVSIAPGAGGGRRRGGGRGRPGSGRRGPGRRAARRRSDRGGAGGRLGRRRDEVVQAAGERRPAATAVRGVHGSGAAARRALRRRIARREPERPLDRG